MPYRSFEEWRDSNDGPRHHDLSDADLRNAFEAGMELGAAQEMEYPDVSGGGVPYTDADRAYDIYAIQKDYGSI